MKVIVMLNIETKRNPKTHTHLCFRAFFEDLSSNLGRIILRLSKTKILVTMPGNKCLNKLLILKLSPSGGIYLMSQGFFHNLRAHQTNMHWSISKASVIVFLVGIMYMYNFHHQCKFFLKSFHVFHYLKI
jgi:cation transport ATPase